MEFNNKYDTRVIRTDYKIYYERYDSNEECHVTFDTLQQLEECLNKMRERNKSVLTYFNIVCKKETVERLYI